MGVSSRFVALFSLGLFEKAFRAQGAVECYSIKIPSMASVAEVSPS